MAKDGMSFSGALISSTVLRCRLAAYVVGIECLRAATLFGRFVSASLHLCPVCTRVPPLSRTRLVLGLGLGRLAPRRYLPNHILLTVAYARRISRR